MDLEVLVVTMGQEDLSLAEKMNIRGDVLIANQCGRWDETCLQTDHGTVRMLSSDTVGVGHNRNLAMQLARGDIWLFADDDVTYYDGALQGVLDAFEELPDADVIFFGIDMTKNGEIFDRRRNRKQRLHIWNCLKYGAARMAVRRSAVEEARLSFSTLFGGGCIYGSGEDTLFTCDCLRRGLRVYAHPHVLGRCAKDTSSWFTGFDEKYMFDKGAWVACAFPGTKHLMKWYFAWRYLPKTELPFQEVIRHMDRGIRAYGRRLSYKEAAAAAEQSSMEGRI